MRLWWTAAGLAEAQKSSPPRSVTSSTPPRPRRPPLLAPPDALTRSGPPPKIYSGRDILLELGALRSGSGLLEAFESGGPSAAWCPGLDHGELMTMAGYVEQVPAQAASASA